MANTMQLLMMTDTERKALMGKTEERLEEVEQYNMADEPRISDKIRQAIAEVAKLSYCTDLGEVPFDTMMAHSFLFDIQLHLMSSNPRQIRAKAEEAEDDEKGEKTIRMKWQPRINPSDWQIIMLPDDLDLTEDPELAAYVEGLAARVQHRYIYAHYGLGEATHWLKHPEQAMGKISRDKMRKAFETKLKASSNASDKQALYESGKATCGDKPANSEDMELACQTYAAICQENLKKAQDNHRVVERASEKLINRLSDLLVVDMDGKPSLYRREPAGTDHKRASQSAYA